MSNETTDIMEIFIKTELEIPLTEHEKQIFDNIDEDIHNTVLELVNNDSYYEETIKIMDSVMKQITDLSEEQQRIINEKYKAKKHKLLLEKFGHQKDHIKHLLT